MGKEEEGERMKREGKCKDMGWVGEQKRLLQEMQTGVLELNLLATN